MAATEPSDEGGSREPETIVIALGGNALLRRGERLDPATQERNVEAAAAAIGRAVARRDRLVITHGNGPQVGLLALAELARSGSAEPFPLDVIDAESEGMIGYLLARHLHPYVGRPIAPLLTQVVVDADDPAFAGPSKPIGPMYSEEEARAVASRLGWTVAPDGPTGWRRVVASPMPRRIVELASIEVLLASGAVVVCAGGGGVPVVEEDGALRGVEAVVDKDATSALLAIALGADRLVLLTDVPAVIDGWGTPAARPISRATPAELADRGFAEGSMGPKVRAASSFATQTGHAATIGSLDQVGAVLAGTAGTTITTTETA